MNNETAPSTQIKEIKPSAKYAALIERQKRGEFKNHEEFLKEAAKVCQSSPVEKYEPSAKPIIESNTPAISLDELLKNIELASD